MLCQAGPVPARDPGHPGHTVLQVPVPALERFVRSRYRHYDPAYLSADPDFTHAHVTALAPFLAPEAFDDEARAVVAGIAASVAPFEFVLDRIATFPDGTIHLRPEPDTPFRALTSALVAAFPGHPPYGGRYDDVAPHLTLDRRSRDVGEESTRVALGADLPARCRAERLDLAWYRAHDCRVLESWPLG